MKNDPFRGDLYSVVVRNLVVPLWAAKERSPYPRLLKHFEKSQFRAYEEVREDQWKRAKAMLSHAWEQTEYYRDRFGEAGITPEDIRSWEDWRKIPILTKDDIRRSGKRMVARNIGGVQKLVEV